MRRFPHKSSLLLLMSALLLGASSSVYTPGPTASFSDDEMGGKTATKCHMDYSFRGLGDGYDIWYSDDYFRVPSTQYNPHLASLSAYAAKFSMMRSGPKNPQDSEFYEEQTKRPETFFKCIGFQNFDGNDDYSSRTRFDSIGVGCAYRKIDDIAVIGVVIRSGSYFNEWENNMFLGDGSNSDMMHEGWYNAANKAIDHINKYIASFQDVIGSRVKLWISGFSRGAATANITAGLLDNKFGDDGTCQLGSGNIKVTLHHDDLYAYTFETPQGANIYSKNVKHPKDPIYNNIFNIINPNDIVPKVAMSHLGFTRFGLDKFSVTRFFGTKRYDASRKSASALGEIHTWECDNVKLYNLPTIKILVDITNFVSFAIDLITTFVDTGTSVFPGFFEEDVTKSKYDGNILMTLLLDEAMSIMGGRGGYCALYQGPLRALIAKATTDEDGAEYAANIASFILQVLVGSIALSVFGPLTSLFSIFTDDIFTTHQLDPIFTLLGAVFVEYPNELITLVGNLSNIFHNHDTDLCIEFTLAQDSLYVDDYNKNNPNDPIELVPFLNSASFRRIRFNDFNEVSVYNRDDNLTRNIQITGHLFGASTIEHCHYGYACGYYSYATSEALELFIPDCYRYRIVYNDWTKTMYKHVSAFGYVYRNHNEKTDNDRYYKQRWTIYDDWVFYGGSEQTQDIGRDEDPEPGF